MVLAEPNFQSISKSQFVRICFWNWILVETKPLEFLLSQPKLKVGGLLTKRFGGFLANEFLHVIIQILIKSQAWKITWQDGTVHPAAKLLAKSQTLNFAARSIFWTGSWELTNQILILLGGPQFLILVGARQKIFDFGWWPTKIIEIGRWATIVEILVGGQPKFLKFVGEQPFPKFWSVANHNFRNWLVSNHFSKFGRWPTKFFENGWWPTNLFFYFFCTKSELCTLIFAKIEAVHTYFQLFLTMCTLILANLQVCTLIKLNLVGGQPKFLKLVGEQPLLKFWSVANICFEIGRWATIFQILVGGQPFFWNWSVSSHFWKFGRWPTIIFEIGLWFFCQSIFLEKRWFCQNHIGQFEWEYRENIVEICVHSGKHRWPN